MASQSLDVKAVVCKQSLIFLFQILLHPYFASTNSVIVPPSSVRGRFALDLLHFFELRVCTLAMFRIYTSVDKKFLRDFTNTCT